MVKAAEAAPDSEARAVHKALAWVSEEQVKHADILAFKLQRLRCTFDMVGLHPSETFKESVTWLCESIYVSTRSQTSRT